MKTSLSFEKNVIQPFFLYLIFAAFKNSDKKCNINRCNINKAEKSAQQSVYILSVFSVFQ